MGSKCVSLSLSYFFSHLLFRSCTELIPCVSFLFILYPSSLLTCPLPPLPPPSPSLSLSYFIALSLLSCIVCVFAQYLNSSMHFSLYIFLCSFFFLLSSFNSKHALRSRSLSVDPSLDKSLNFI